jgi:hypothetical protein
MNKLQEFALLSVITLARIDTAELVAGRALIITWALAE